MTSADPRSAFLEQLHRDVKALRTNYQGLVRSAKIGSDEVGQAEASADSVRRQGLELRLCQEKIITSAQSLLRLIGQLRYSKALQGADGK
jgi:hypothetical protein